jgi:hypothetical protein
LLGWEKVPAHIRETADDEAYILTLVEDLILRQARRNTARRITSVGQRTKRLSCDQPPKDGPVEGTLTLRGHSGRGLMAA